MSNEINRNYSDIKKQGKKCQISVKAVINK